MNLGDSGDGISVEPLAGGSEDHSSSSGNAAVGDTALAGLGVAVLLLGIALTVSPGLMGALLLLLLLSATTAVATYTAVVGQTASPWSRAIGGILAAVLAAVVLWNAERVGTLLLPIAAIAAGLGRTRSWRWRLVGLSCASLLTAVLLIGAEG